MNSTVIYVHIPKTAGSTLGAILEHNFDSARIFNIYDHPQQGIERLKSLPAAQRDQLQLIKGHFAYGIHQYLSQPFEYITILRDPVERTISHFYHVLRDPNHYLHKRVVSEKMGLKEYVLGRIKELDNWQVRSISGQGGAVPFGACTRELLEQAKKHLQDCFSVIGLQERFDETVLLMSGRFGWKTTRYVPRNVSKKRPPREKFSADTLDAVGAVNALDLELYEFAKTLFDRAAVQSSSSP